MHRAGSIGTRESARNDQHALDPTSSSSQAHTGCLNCGLLAWCQSGQLAARDAARFSKHITHHRPVKRGAYLHHAEGPLESLHVIHSGFLKTTTGNESGLEQVTGFLMPGDPAGMDGIDSGKHQFDTVAIEDSSVCSISFGLLEQLCGEFPGLQRDFLRLLSTEINRNHGLMLLLGVMNAEERLIVFLLNLSARFAARGYSATQFRLPMRHQDIGSHLGLSMETISRLLTKLSNDEAIALDHKYLRIKTVEGLKQRLGDYKKCRSTTRTADSQSSEIISRMR